MIESPTPAKDSPLRPIVSAWLSKIKAAKDRIDHDCAYVQNFSLALDVRIITQTIAREFLTGSGV